MVKFTAKGSNSNNIERTIVTLSSHSCKDPIQYVRQTDIDVVRHKELVLTLARKKDYITRKDVIELLHVSGPQAYRLLKKLVEEERLIVSGSTSAAKYAVVK